jgi:hypothetical protein
LGRTWPNFLHAAVGPLSHVAACYGISQNFTPLMAAALCGHVEVVKQLLDYGADPTVKNKRGKTALDLASVEGEVAHFGTS